MSPVDVNRARDARFVVFATSSAACQWVRPTVQRVGSRLPTFSRSGATHWQDHRGAAFDASVESRD